MGTNEKLRNVIFRKQLDNEPKTKKKRKKKRRIEALAQRKGPKGWERRGSTVRGRRNPVKNHDNDRWKLIIVRPYLRPVNLSIPFETKGLGGERARAQHPRDKPRNIGLQVKELSFDGRHERRGRGAKVWRNRRKRAREGNALIRCLGVKVLGFPPCRLRWHGGIACGRVSRKNKS